MVSIKYFTYDFLNKGQKYQYYKHMTGRKRNAKNVRMRRQSILCSTLYKFHQQSIISKLTKKINIGGEDKFPFGLLVSHLSQSWVREQRTTYTAKLIAHLRGSYVVVQKAGRQSGRQPAGCHCCQAAFWRNWH